MDKNQDVPISMEQTIIAHKESLENDKNGNEQQVSEENDASIDVKVGDEIVPDQASDDSMGDLDEDDLDLIAENTGIQIKKSRKRIRILDEEIEAALESNQKETPLIYGPGKRKRVTENSKYSKQRELLANELFGASDEDDDDIPTAPISTKQSSNRRDQPEMIARESEEEDDDEEEYEDDFIVDDIRRDVDADVGFGEPYHQDEFSAALAQAQDIFGVDIDSKYFISKDISGVRRKHAKKLSKRSKSQRVRIKDIFDPEELEKLNLTEADEIVRTKDIPERLQHRVSLDQPVDEELLNEEARWIHQQIVVNRSLLNTNQKSRIEQEPKDLAYHSEFIRRVRDILDLILNQHFEIPYIYHHRKDQIHPDINDLWQIWDLDASWKSFYHRRTRLSELYTKMQQYQQLLSNGIQDSDNLEFISQCGPKIHDEIIHSVQTVRTSEELSDYQNYFMLHYNLYLESMSQVKDESPEHESDISDCRIDEQKGPANSKQKTFRRPHAQSPYLFYMKNKIHQFLSYFGLSSVELAHNFSDGYQLHAPRKFSILPREAASQIVTPLQAEDEQIIRMGQRMWATQISREPLMRKFARKYFTSNAQLFVTPTKRGKREIDQYHPYASFKYISEKPIFCIKPQELVQIMKAKSDGLLDVRLTISSRTKQSIYNKWRNYYEIDEFSKLTEEWNTVRRYAVEMAFDQFLFPFLEMETFNTILGEANDQLIRQCSAKLLEYMNIVPLVSHIQEDSSNYRCRILSFAIPSEIQYKTNSNIGGIVSGSNKPNDLSSKISSEYASESSIEVPYAVFISEAGQVIDFIKLPDNFVRILKKQIHNPSMFHLVDEAMKVVHDAFFLHRPSVICLPIETREHFKFLSYLKTHWVPATVAEFTAREDFMENDDIDNSNVGSKVIGVNSFLPRSLKSSTGYVSEFLMSQDTFRHAVATARYVLNPLVEIAHFLESEPEESAILYLSSFQSVLPKEKLWEKLQECLIQFTNTVGVDLNLALKNERYSILVRKICGLGRRKASSLLKTLSQKSISSLSGRNQLVIECEMGPKIFVNASAFIKFTSSYNSDIETHDGDQVDDPLDSTRIHPQFYEWARKMIVDALDYDSTEEIDYHAAMEELMKNSEKLKELDLEVFASELEKQGAGCTTKALFHIRDEFLNPFADPRIKSHETHDIEWFWLIASDGLCSRDISEDQEFRESYSGEFTSLVLSVGKTASGTVIGFMNKRPSKSEMDNAAPIRNPNTGDWSCPFCYKEGFQDLSDAWKHMDSDCSGSIVGVRILLERGLIGLLSVKNISDNPPKCPTERVNIGMTVQCRLLKANPEKFQFEVSTKTSDLADHHRIYRASRDPYFDTHLEELDLTNDSEISKKNSQKSVYHRRVISHPSFHNITYKDAEEMLTKMNSGDCIIRPSSKGIDHLTLSWKVTNGIYHHVDILEKDKPNSFSVGKSLLIDEERYEDLDEVIARCVHPMHMYATQIMRNKYYTDSEDGSRQKLAQILEVEKSKTPIRIPYLFSASKQFPGKFVLAYLPHKTPRFELISLTANGLKYRSRVFSNLNELISWFKVHFKDPLPRNKPQTISSVTNTPQLSAAPTPLSEPRDTPVFNQPNSRPSRHEYGHENTQFSRSRNRDAPPNRSDWNSGRGTNRIHNNFSSGQSHRHNSSLKVSRQSSNNYSTPLSNDAEEVWDADEPSVPTNNTLRIGGKTNPMPASSTSVNSFNFTPTPRSNVNNHPHEESPPWDA